MATEVGLKRQKRYDNLIRICFIFYIILLTAFSLSLFLSQYIYVGIRRERWGMCGATRGKVSKRKVYSGVVGESLGCKEGQRVRHGDKEVGVEAGGHCIKDKAQK